MSEMEGKSAKDRAQREYVPPKAVRLGGARDGAGHCQPGSGDGVCISGTSAYGTCGGGNSTSVCGEGNSAQDCYPTGSSGG